MIKKLMTGLILLASLLLITGSALADKSVFFGLGQQYDDGVQTRVALNSAGVIVEVHKSQSNYKLWYHVGSPNKASVTWGNSHEYDSGVTPFCAVNSSNKVVEVHKSQSNNGLWYHVGTVSGMEINWSGSHKYDSGINPSVAMNNNNVVVEVHRSEGKTGLWYHVGTLNQEEVNWSGSRQYDNGSNPSVALNNQGVVVEVHKSESNSGLWYHVGKVDGSSIKWGSSVKYDTGVNPTVALTDDGMVIETHKSENFATVWQRVGRVNGNNIDWYSDSANYDDGIAPSVACNGKLAIQTHQSENFTTLWYSTSLLTDRANWMGDNLGNLKNLTLKQLILPASHDSGMYDHGITETFAKTQDLSIYGQLSYGIRYYDLRPGWDGSDFYLYHGPVKGPKLSTVLTDVLRFMNESHHELIILKFSHYKDFNDDRYRTFTQRITARIGQWLFTTLPAGKRLADIQLGNYISNQGVILAVCDDNYPVDNPVPGVWVYRDWNASDPAKGDLRVFDRYSDTMSYDKMKSDQLKKYEDYNGKCEQDPKVPCDQFLLSWTLTPPTAVWPVSKEANRNLGDVMAQLTTPNSFGCYPNLLYVDYVEYARVTDVAILQNGISF